MLALFALTLVAAPVELARTERFEVVAEANQVRYEVRIALPRSFATGTQRYPLLVLLDADYSFPAAHAIVNHLDRKSTRLNSSHLVISYAVFCLKKKKQQLSNLIST